MSTDKAREAFLKEAGNVGSLQHEGISHAYDFGQEHDGSCFIVYRFIDGMTLA
jgi:serine/threonine protein kinase